jgi:hypothetical protein
MENQNQESNKQMTEIDRYDRYKKQVYKRYKNKYDTDEEFRKSEHKRAATYRSEKYKTDPEFREKAKAYQRALYAKKKELKMKEYEELQKVKLNEE